MSFSDAAELITALAAIGAVVMSARNGYKIQEVHLSINSRMDQLLVAASEAARASGVAQEKAEAAKKTSAPMDLKQ